MKRMRSACIYTRLVVVGRWLGGLSEISDIKGCVYRWVRVG